MTVAATALPFGLREVQIQKLSADGTAEVGSLIKLPYSRTFSFKEIADSTELRGDDDLVATHNLNPAVDWELEAGGLNFEAVAAMYGGTVTVTGTPPNEVKRLRKHKDDQRPYFRVTGRSISDSGGDVHCIVYRCKASGDLEGEMADGQFFLTSAKGMGFPNLIAGDDLGVVYDFVQYETSTVIS